MPHPNHCSGVLHNGNSDLVKLMTIIIKTIIQFYLIYYAIIPAAKKTIMFCKNRDRINRPKEGRISCYIIMMCVV